MNKLIQKAVLSAFLVFVMCCFVLAPAKAQIDPVIRVYLRRLKIEDSMRISLHGTYMLEDGTMLFSENAEVSITLREGQLVLHTGNASIRMGETIKLVRCDAASGLKINDSNLYEGDLLLSASDNVIRPILYTHVEDYLKGVVPYEMGDQFPLEALKAQAIAARTYALRKSGSGTDYDVEDTTNDQAYRGRSSNSPVSEQAVQETNGIVGMYRGRLAQCYYSASNGGQTELGQHVWPTSDPDAYGYMDQRDDPYDYENSASLVKRFTLPKKPREIGVGETLHQALVEALSGDLMALNRQIEPDCVRIDEICSVEVIAPKFGGDSRLMTQMQFELLISVRDCIFRDTASAPQATPTPHSSIEPMPTPTPTPQPTATPAYTDYEQLKDEFTVTIPIFPTIEYAMGLSINAYQNELITVTDIGSAFMIESRRYGHGVGMSQRGAEQMARRYDMSYVDILSFYYPGITLEKLDYTISPLLTPDMTIMATPGPTASPTPRPTLMPVNTQNMPKGSYLAIVANIDDDSSLNLRETPSLSGEVLRRLYKYQELVVLSVSKDGWAHVKTDVIEGYVKNEFLQTAN